VITYQPIQPGGTLHIKIKEAVLSRDVRVMGSMDPYAEIEFKKLKFKTPVCHNGGKHPKWNHSEFSVKLLDFKEEFCIEVRDAKVFKNTKIGKVSLNALALCTNNGVS
jgi:Ca2+-dependent lipid-binding protein